MPRTSSTLIVLQLLINIIDNDGFDEGEGGGNKTNLSNSSAFKKSIRAGYLTSKSAEKGGGNSKSGGGNTKKGVKANKSSDYLTSGAKKTFNLLRHAFTQTLITQHFDPKRYI